MEIMIKDFAYKGEKIDEWAILVETHLDIDKVPYGSIEDLVRTSLEEDVHKFWRIEED